MNKKPKKQAAKKRSRQAVKREAGIPVSTPATRQKKRIKKKPPAKVATSNEVESWDEALDEAMRKFLEDL